MPQPTEEMNDYFSIISKDSAGAAHTFEVELNPAAEVYKGHFPGNPISPGVCSIGMIAACAGQAAGMEFETASVSRCRFLNLVTPGKTPRLRIEMTLGDKTGETHPVAAKIIHGETVCVDLKGTLAVVDR